MVWNGIDLDNNLSKQKFSHRDISTKYQYLTGIAISMPTCTFYEIIDVDYQYHALTYILVQH